MADPDGPPPERTPVLRNVIQTGQLLQMIPAILLLGTVLKGIWMASAAFSNLSSSLVSEQAARIAAETELKQEMLAETRDLAAKIDANTAMTDQKLSSLSDKITDLKTEFGSVVQASTPTHGQHR